MLLEGHVGSDGLYDFPPISMSPTAKSSPLPTSLPVKVVPRAYSTSADSNLPNVWHLRLGHPNVYVLKLVLQHCNIPFHYKDHSLFCYNCCMGNAHRHHSHTSHTIYSSLLEL